MIIINNLNKNIFYYVSPYGLGDTLMIMMFKKCLEHKLGGKIILIIKPFHDIIVKMFDCYDFIVYNGNIDCLYQEAISKGLMSNVPQKGKLYFSHPNFNEAERLRFLPIFDTRKYNFMTWYKMYLNLSLESIPQDYTIKTDFHESLINKLLSNNIDVNKRIALIIPLARTAPNFSNSYWENVINNIPSDFQIVSHQVQLKGATYINIHLGELLELAKVASIIHTNRSGLADVLHKMPEKLVVHYVKKSDEPIYSLNNIYHCNVKEVYPY